MKIFLFLFVFNICFPQATSFPFYGVGELIGNQDISSIGLGNGTFYSGNQFEIASSSPSSLWKTPFTRFSIHSGMNYLKVPTFPEQFQHDLTHFSVLFPIGGHKAFGFGLKPAYRTNTIEIDQNFEFLGVNNVTTSLPIAYQNSFFLKGGISDLFIQYSFKFNSKLSFGFQYSFLFGNQTVDERRRAYEVNIDSTQSNQMAIYEFWHDDGLYYLYEEHSEDTYLKNSNRFSGSRMILEGKYIYDIHEFTFRTSIDGKMIINRKDMQNTSDTVYYNYYDYKVSDNISELALGYHYKKIKNLGFIMEARINHPIDLPEAISLFNILAPKERSVHFGFYKRINNPKFSLWNNVNLRTGFYLKELNSNGNDFVDLGFTLGFGLEYLSNSQSIDIALRSGKRESLIVNDKFENYLSLHIGVMTGEKWFMKRRRK